MSTILPQEREEQLRECVAALDAEQRKAYYQLLKPRLKNPDTYAALNYLFIAGLHHFYLGKWLRGTLNLAVFCLSILLIATGYWEVGILAFLCISAIELHALFFSQSIVLKHNNKETELLLAKFVS